MKVFAGRLQFITFAALGFASKATAALIDDDQFSCVLQKSQYLEFSSVFLVLVLVLMPLTYLFVKSGFFYSLSSNKGEKQ